MICAMCSTHVWRVDGVSMFPRLKKDIISGSEIKIKFLVPYNAYYHASGQLFFRIFFLVPINIGLHGQSLLLIFALYESTTPPLLL